MFKPKKHLRSNSGGIFFFASCSTSLPNINTCEMVVQITGDTNKYDYCVIAQSMKQTTEKYLIKHPCYLIKQVIRKRESEYLKRWNKWFEYVEPKKLINLVLKWKNYHVCPYQHTDVLLFVCLSLHNFYSFTILMSCKNSSICFVCLVRFSLAHFSGVQKKWYPTKKFYAQSADKGKRVCDRFPTRKGWQPPRETGHQIRGECEMDVCSAGGPQSWEF